MGRAIVTVLGLALMAAVETCGGGASTARAQCPPADLTHLPFGDSRILRRDQGQTQPAPESLWLCGVPPDGSGNSNAQDWTNADGTWDYTLKPTVDGDVAWPSQLEVTLDGQGSRIITGNGLPSTPTGVFPIDPASIAYQYDRNPSHIEPWVVNLKLPAMPQVAARPGCLPYGPAGISLTGNAIYHGASTLATDASAYEMLDGCGGQSDGTLTYHTHFLTQCLLDALDPCVPGHSALMGYILDGFGIYGPRGENGAVLTSSDLDACHGHAHPVSWDGQTINLYHYHWTYDFPYNVGCFKGTRALHPVLRSALPDRAAPLSSYLPLDPVRDHFTDTTGAPVVVAGDAAAGGAPLVFYSVPDASWLDVARSDTDVTLTITW